MIQCLGGLCGTYIRGGLSITDDGLQALFLLFFFFLVGGYMVRVSLTAVR